MTKKRLYLAIPTALLVLLAAVRAQNRVVHVDFASGLIWIQIYIAWQTSGPLSTGEGSNS